MANVSYMNVAGRVTVTDPNGNEVFPLGVNGESFMNISNVTKDVPNLVGSIVAAGGVFSFNCSQYFGLAIQFSGTFTGASFAFEASINSTDGTNGDWSQIAASKMDALTANFVTGAINSPHPSIYKVSVNGYKYFRIRAIALISGASNITIKPVSGNIEPVPAVPTHSVTVSSLVNVSTTQTAISNFIDSIAGVTNQLLISTPCSLHSFYASNSGTSPAHVKLYNKATAPVVGTDIPEMIIPIPPITANGSIGYFDMNTGPLPHRFNNGLGIVISGGAGVQDTTAVASGQIKVKLQRS